MDKHKIEVLPAAWDDLQRIGDYIALDSPAAAKRTVDKIVGSLRRLEIFPLSAPPVSDEDLARMGYRVLGCGKYLCFYRVIDGVVVVYHVIHAARNYPALLECVEASEKKHDHQTNA